MNLIMDYYEIHIQLLWIVMDYYDTSVCIIMKCHMRYYEQYELLWMAEFSNSGNRLWRKCINKFQNYFFVSPIINATKTSVLEILRLKNCYHTIHNNAELHYYENNIELLWIPLWIIMTSMCALLWDHKWIIMKYQMDYYEISNGLLWNLCCVIMNSLLNYYDALLWSLFTISIPSTALLWNQIRVIMKICLRYYEAFIIIMRYYDNFIITHTLSLILS